MEKQEIIQENIEEAKSRIKEKILIDNLIIFVSRVLEDLQKQDNPKVFGRAKELYLSINPYSRYDGNIMLDFFRFKYSGAHDKDFYGMKLEPKEAHFLEIIFNEMNNDFHFRNPKVMKGRIKGILNKLCEKYLPQSSDIVEPLIISRMISAARGIERLKDMPASTIQLIGAENALFRHLSKKNSNSPKYGLLYYSKFVQKEKNKGKKARQLANKLAISIKVDYFRRFKIT